ncbi:unnamed protein product [marine sediment metagenome]|uniref:Uncharacterized protein n=1 Tax=marine sediment metagenome TaxID=412755 RepID=X1RDT1_9ZZZZ
MVKITNPLGDVKIGRQGEVVYQRKYGEQIRRQASPKRAMASQAQITHRNLYRDALTWRSNLSLANRRYLEGYCMANGVFDSYRIPLTWSRFALKLYLQAIKFVVIDKAVAGEEGTEGRFEWYDDWNSHVGYRSSHWGAQSFTPSLTHQLSKVRLKCSRSHDDDLRDVVVSIKATDGSGHPFGEDIVSKTEDSLNFGLVANTWHDFPFDTNPTLSSGIKYAIVLRAPSCPISKYINVGRDTTSPAYVGGCMIDSTNSGGTWTNLAQDWSFEEYGLSPGIEAIPGLIHVRHPALLTVVQKRGVLTGQAYEDLSSLDEEYLTGQVGLDVIAGDIIEATTLPGIKDTFLVM